MIKRCPNSQAKPNNLFGDHVPGVASVKGGIAIVCATCGLQGAVVQTNDDALDSWNGAPRGQVDPNTPAVTLAVATPT